MGGGGCWDRGGDGVALFDFAVGHATVWLQFFYVTIRYLMCRR